MKKVRATKDAWVVSLSGHSVDMKAGGVYEVPDEIFTEVVINGAILLPSDTVSDSTPAESEGRTEAIERAVKHIFAQKQHTQFSAPNVPKVSSVVKVSGIADVTAEEIAEAVVKMQADIA